MPIRKYTGPTPPSSNNGGNNNSGNSGSSNSTTPTPVPPTTATQATKIDLPKGLSDMHLGKYRPVAYREKETIDLITVLNKADKPNALIIAKAGAGKTAVVKHLAHLIDTKDPILPDTIIDSHLYELSLTAIGAGNSLVGQTEQAIQDVLNFATNPDNKAIIFIDEVHQLFDGDNMQTNQLSQALKPAMARDNFRFIGATTTGESKTVLKDPAISRRIEEVRMHDLTLRETTSIVKDALPRYRQHHNVLIDDDLAETIVKLSDLHYLKSARPDNALTLIDQAGSYQAMKYHQLTAGLPDSVVQKFPIAEKTVDKDTLLETINRHTGNSASSTPYNLEGTMKSKIKGQDEAIEDISKRITLFRSNIMPSKTPLSIFLSGPTGNGKTETAKSIAKALFNDTNRMTVIDMTEYSQPSSINQLIGSPDGYVGSNSKRITPFDTVYENPSQILLLDEFEKANKEVHHLFYQILEEGYIEDRRGRRIDFSKSILIFTSNAATDDASHSVGFGVQAAANSSNFDQQQLIKSLSNYIPDALLNRMTRVYKYQSISIDAYKDILKLNYDKMVAEILENRPDMNIDPNSLTDDMLNQWAEESYDPILNGRPAKNFIKTKLEEATLDAIMANSNDIIVK